MNACGISTFAWRAKDAVSTRALANPSAESGSLMTMLSSPPSIRFAAWPSPAFARSSINPLSKVFTGSCICLAKDTISARCNSGVFFACFA
ncbi:hypothetical protein D3C86_1777490 [compost metagenome]